MGKVEFLTTFEEIKLLSDARRLAILRLLMAAPATLTHLGRALGQHPAWVRHHLKKLEDAGLVAVSEVRLTSGVAPVTGVAEKFYQARANAFVVREMLLPDLRPAHPVVILSGSDDLAVELLAQHLSPHLDLLTLPLGSLDGLVALRQGLCHLAGAHLFDLPSGEYNAPYVRHIIPDRSTTLFTLAHREQGLMVASGNPRRIRGLADLARPDVAFVNRQRGSGTRLWLDHQLQELGIPASRDEIRGYEHEVRTHTECAHLVQQGEADAALGLAASARQHELDFIPLFYERYDLILPREQTDMLAPLLDMLQTSEFRRSVESLSGYDTTHTGEQLSLQ